MALQEIAPNTVAARPQRRVQAKTVDKPDETKADATIDHHPLVWRGERLIIRSSDPIASVNRLMSELKRAPAWRDPRSTLEVRFDPPVIPEDVWASALDGFVAERKRQNKALHSRSALRKAYEQVEMVLVERCWVDFMGEVASYFAGEEWQSCPGAAWDGADRVCMGLNIFLNPRHQKTALGVRIVGAMGRVEDALRVRVGSKDGSFMRRVYSTPDTIMRRL